MYLIGLMFSSRVCYCFYDAKGVPVTELYYYQRDTVRVIKSCNLFRHLFACATHANARHIGISLVLPIGLKL